MTEADLDVATALASFLVVDVTKRSTALTRYFVEQASSDADELDAPRCPPRGRWVPMSEAQVDLGFVMAINVVRGAGFADEAHQLARLSEVHGHG